MFIGYVISKFGDLQPKVLLNLCNTYIYIAIFFNEFNTWMLGPLTNSIQMKYKCILEINNFQPDFLYVKMYWPVHVLHSSVIMQILFFVIN